VVLGCCVKLHVIPDSLGLSCEMLYFPVWCKICNLSYDLVVVRWLDGGLYFAVCG